MKYVILTLLSFFLTGSYAQQFAGKLQLCKPAIAADSVYCGSYAVFENHQRKTGRKINLNIMVIPAIDSKKSGNPIFYFDGGPGIGTTKNVDFFSERSNPYRQNHDIVLVDIRGTGGSNPLHCLSLQYKRNLQQHFEEMYPAEAVKSCFDSLSAIADLTQYTTTNIVKDIDEVRQWLGYEKIVAVGLSYGGRLTLEYIRRFPTSVETAVLWSPSSTGNKIPLYHAQFAQDTWNKLANDCMNDTLCNKTFPELKKDFTALMNRMKRRPEIIKTDSSTVTLTWDAFQTKIRTQMYLPYTLKQLPFIINAAVKGNWKPFLDLYPKEYKLNNFSAEGLYLSITCSEDVPFIKKKETKSLAKNTFMGNYRVAQQKQACANWVRGEIPADFLQPVRSNIPVLIIAGEWDPVTPVSLAREVARHLPNSQLVVVPEMSHLAWGVTNENCLENISLEFISTSGKSKVNKDCIETMKPPAYKIN